MKRWSKKQKACVGRLLLCVRRLERGGDVVVMDPAVLEEMLELHKVRLEEEEEYDDVY